MIHVARKGNSSEKKDEATPASWIPDLSDIDKYEETLSKWIIKHPIAGVGIALALGVGIGWIIKRSLR